jgi:hypothetical protein
MWSCAVNTLVHIRSRTFGRAKGLSSGVPITLLMSKAPDASKFRVFLCIVFAKVHGKLRRKLGEKTFHSVMVGYTPNARGYRVYNVVTLRIYTSVHVVF